MTRPSGADHPDRPDGAAALRALMLAGDAEALDRLARDYGPRLLAVARRCCRCRDDAEDAVQQALVSATTSRHGYRGDGHPAAWLSTLVARSCFRMNREAHNDPSRTVHHGHDEDDEHGSRVRTPCGGGADPEERAAQRQLEERLGEALMALSRTDRLAFLLAAEGHTSEEIAAEFHLTSDAVRGRLKRARKVLRAHLAPFVELHVTHPGAPAAPPGNTGNTGNTARDPTSPEDNPWPARSPP